MTSAAAIWSSNTDHNGRFLACPGFPECRNTKPIWKRSGRALPGLRQGCGDPQDEEGTKILWVRRQPELRIYVLAEAIHEEVIRGVEAIW